MALLAEVPNRARFAISWPGVLDLPVSLRDAMLEQIEEWRLQEDSPAKK
jgi:hypothetical protein